MKHLRFLFSALAGMILISGCGQSGALYIPDDPSTMATPAPPAAEDESEDDENDESSDVDQQ